MTKINESPENPGGHLSRDLLSIVEENPGFTTIRCSVLAPEIIHFNSQFLGIEIL